MREKYGFYFGRNQDALLWSSLVGFDLKFDPLRDKACLQDLLEGNLPGLLRRFNRRSPVLFWRRRQKITDDIEWNLFKTRLSGEFFGSGGDNRFHSFGTVRVHTSLARG